MNSFEKILDAYAVSNGPGFACVVVEGEEVLFKGTKGVKCIESDAPIDAHTTFRLASVSKQFIAAGILLLARERRFSLDDSLREFIPDFPEYGAFVTIRHLLTHTSGLKDYEEFLPLGQHPVDDEDVLAILMGQTSGYFEPGEQYRYSNGGYCLLHLIIERITGQSLDLFLTERIFAPHSMDDAFIHTAGMPDTGGMSYGHSVSEKGYTVNNQDKTSWTIGDGGVYASINDMLTWGAVLLSRKLDGVDLAEMFEPHVNTDEPGRAYGYGLVVLETPKGQIIYHEGETVGFRTCVYVCPAENLYIATLFNHDDVDPLKVCEALADSIHDR